MWPNDPGSYAGGNIATGRVTQAGQVKGDGPHKNRHTGSPCWVFCEGPATLPHKINCKLKTLNEGMKPDSLLDADEPEYKGIQVINYILEPGM